MCTVPPPRTAPHRTPALWRGFDVRAEGDGADGEGGTKRQLEVGHVHKLDDALLAPALGTWCGVRHTAGHVRQ